MLHVRYWLSMGLLFVGLLSPANAQQTLRPGRLDSETLAALRPGLTLQVFAAEYGDGRQPPLDARQQRLAAIFVPAGTPVTPFVEPGPFAASLTGYLKVALKGEHTLHLASNCSAKLSVNGEEVTAANNVNDGKLVSSAGRVELVKGYNEIKLVVASRPDGAAQLRVTWSGRDFIEEPLPPDSLFSRGDLAPLSAGDRLRLGRELFASRNCRACHELSGVEQQMWAMPELAFEVPSLARVGERLDPNWLAAWILEPKKLSADASMPQLLNHTDPNINAQDAADLAAYLSSLKQPSAATAPPAASPRTSEDRVQQGLEAFENLGCIACHHLDVPDRENDYNRLSLHFANAKFLPGQLTAFLQEPDQHDASSRMPDFQLSADEAGALAAFIKSRVQGEVTNEDRKGDAERGAKLFQSVGCANCHTTNDRPATTKNIKTLAAAELDRGCLAARTDQRDGAPEFHFSTAQREGLLAFLATDRRSLARETPAEFSLRQVRALNCVACHRRDGASNVHSLVLSEEGEQGLAPEILPLLTWAGEKLKPDWTEKLLAGQREHRSRHWLRARMPVFPAYAKHLAIGLSHEHGFASDQDTRPAPNRDLAKVGAQLVESEGGFGCIKCHAIGDRKPLAPFEAPGINLVDAAARLRYSYYPRWMLDPPRVDVLTKMPKFSVDGRTTGVIALDGDAAQQNLALWHYLQTLQK